MINLKVLAAIILIILATSIPSFALEKGVKIPSFAVKDQNGHVYDLSGFEGNIVYIDFWASWCGPCKKSLPWLNGISRKYKDKGLKILAINLDTNKQDADKMIASIKPEFEIAFDPDGASPEEFEVDTMPSAFLIDRKGKIVEIYKGFNETDEEAIEKNIAKLLEEGK